MNVDTLKIYDDLKASGVPDAQAHAQAMAIGHTNIVTPNDLVKIREDFKSDIEKLIIKVDTNFTWLSRIMITGVIGIVVNIIIELIKR